MTQCLNNMKTAKAWATGESKSVEIEVEKKAREDNEKILKIGYIFNLREGLVIKEMAIHTEV